MSAMAKLSPVERNETPMLLPAADVPEGPTPSKQFWTVSSVSPGPERTTPPPKEPPAKLSMPRSFITSEFQVIVSPLNLWLAPLRKITGRPPLAVAELGCVLPSRVAELAVIVGNSDRGLIVKTPLL